MNRLTHASRVNDLAEFLYRSIDRRQTVPVPVSPTLDKIILSWPTPIDLASKDEKTRRSWIQLARTGSFTSNRYGKFSITKDDLQSMFYNFKNITPKAPTQLPIDYDHLSMDPKSPGDGIAAGWMRELELREDGDELWAQVEWTKDGARRIENKEYRFVSPSFVKDHTHKDGKKIGTTLLAAAVTNHPFLEGMSALTLFNFSTMGDLALPSKGTVDVAVHLADIGQRVMIAPGNARTQDEIGATFEIVEVVGDGDDSFVSIRDANGVVHRWFRGTELLPASSTPALPANPNLVQGQGQAGVPVQPGQPGAPPVMAMPPVAAPVQAAPGVPGAPVVPTPAVAQAIGSAAPDPNAAVPAAPAMPVAAPPAAQNDPSKNNKEGTPPPFVAKKDAKAAEGAIGTQAQNQPSGHPSAQPVVQNDKKLENEGDESADKTGNDPMAFLKAIAGALATQKGIANMMFKLRNDKNEEIEVSLEQLEAAGIKVVPEGATAVPNVELSDMKGKIVTLSSTVDALKTENEARAKQTLVMALNTELDRLVKGALITKVTRDTLFEQFKDATDLNMFKAITSTFTKPIVELNVEHGSGGDADTKSPGEQATEKLIALRDTLIKEKGMSLRDATIEAGQRLSDDAEAYQDQYRPVA